MGQIPWIFSLVPDAILNWVYWAIIAVGITGIAASWIGKWIPFYGNYVRFLKPAGVILLVLGVWLRGGYDVEMSWRTKVADAQAKVEAAEAASALANRGLEAERKKKSKVRTEYITTVKERIVEKEKLIDAKCELDPSAAQILNDAAKNTSKKGTVTIQEVKK